MSLQSGVPVIDLPVIDLSDCAVSDPGRRDGARRALVECFSSVGFCLIEGLEGWEIVCFFVYKGPMSRKYRAFLYTNKIYNEGLLQHSVPCVARILSMS